MSKLIRLTQSSCEIFADSTFPVRVLSSRIEDLIIVDVAPEISQATTIGGWLLSRSFTNPPSSNGKLQPVHP